MESIKSDWLVLDEAKSADYDNSSPINNNNNKCDAPPKGLITYQLPRFTPVPAQSVFANDKKVPIWTLRRDEVLYRSTGEADSPKVSYLQDYKAFMKHFQDLPQRYTSIDDHHPGNDWCVETWKMKVMRQYPLYIDGITAMMMIRFYRSIVPAEQQTAAHMDVIYTVAVTVCEYINGSHFITDDIVDGALTRQGSPSWHFLYPRSAAVDALTFIGQGLRILYLSLKSPAGISQHHPLADDIIYYALEYWNVLAVSQSHLFTQLYGGLPVEEIIEKCRLKNYFLNATLRVLPYVVQPIHQAMRMAGYTNLKLYQAGWEFAYQYTMIITLQDDIQDAFNMDGEDIGLVMSANASGPPAIGKDVLERVFVFPTTAVCECYCTGKPYKLTEAQRQIVRDYFAEPGDSDAAVKLMEQIVEPLKLRDYGLAELSRLTQQMVWMVNPSSRESILTQTHFPTKWFNETFAFYYFFKLQEHHTVDDADFERVASRDDHIENLTRAMTEKRTVYEK